MAWDVAARWVLMPVLLAQALYLRRTVIQLPPPEGDHHGGHGQGAPLRLLVIGDSSALGVGVSAQSEALLGQVSARLARYRAVSYALVAVSGARTGDVLGWLDKLPSDKFDVVVTCLGVNDVTKAVPLNRFVARQRRLVAEIKARCGDPFVVVSGLPPVHQFPLLPQPLRWILGRQAARFDRNIDRVVAEFADCVVVRPNLELGPHNMAADGFHPGPEVYAAWAADIVALIEAHTDLLDVARDSAYPDGMPGQG